VTRKLVSAITGTWERHGLLMEAIDNLRAQTYRPLEHVVVSDGSDPELREMIDREREATDVPIVFAELGRNWSTFLTNSFSAAPFMTAQLMARGDYQVFFADDERWLDPAAITKLVDVLEEYDCDFAYSQQRMWWADRPEQTTVIGTNPPQNGTITNALYRADAIDKGMLFRPHVGTGTDWDAISRTMDWPGRPRTRWAFVREVLLSHRVDH
jgi:GT2 family glycosyltransferase